jgi:hypothetical protein
VINLVLRIFSRILGNIRNGGYGLIRSPEKTIEGNKLNLKSRATVVFSRHRTWQIFPAHPGFSGFYNVACPGTSSNPSKSELKVDF